MVRLITRSSVSKVTGPLGSWLVRRGWSPDVVTVLGAVATVAAALTLLSTGRFVIGAVLIAVFVLTDMVDGAMARAQGGGTRFGAVLDATCDRVADGAVFASLTWWGFTQGGSLPLAAAGLLCLVTSQVTSYAKARAEASGFAAPKGLVERPSRLVIVLTGAMATGLGLSWALYVALYVLAAGGAITVVQRVLAVRGAEGARDRISV